MSNHLNEWIINVTSRNIDITILMTIIANYDMKLLTGQM